jgi:hypothetical protein
MAPCLFFWRAQAHFLDFPEQPEDQGGQQAVKYKVFNKFKGNVMLYENR